VSPFPSAREGSDPHDAQLAALLGTGPRHCHAGGKGTPPLKQLTLNETAMALPVYSKKTEE